MSSVAPSAGGRHGEGQLLRQQDSTNSERIHIAYSPSQRSVHRDVAQSLKTNQFGRNRKGLAALVSGGHDSLDGPLDLQDNTIQEMFELQNSQNH